VKLKEPALRPECTGSVEGGYGIHRRETSTAAGEKYAYSNVGYTICRGNAESATGVSWEDLVNVNSLSRWQLTDAGFGPAEEPVKTLRSTARHKRLLGWKVPAIGRRGHIRHGPAGAVHMTLGNLCKYAAEHLRGELGAGKLLAAETYKRLHKPALQNYACGWVVKQPTQRIPYTVYWHNGSNTMWYRAGRVHPAKNMVVASPQTMATLKQAESARGRS